MPATASEALPDQENTTATEAAAAAARKSAAKTSAKTAGKPAADEPAGAPPVDPVFDPDEIKEIRQLEAQADHLESQSENFRRDSAKKIVAQLKKPEATLRKLAAAIGRSDTHVLFMARAWLIMEEGQATTFKEAYKKAHAKRVDPGDLDGAPEGAAVAAVAAGEQSSASVQDDGDSSRERRRPGWNGLVKGLKPQIEQMVSQGNEQELTQLSNLLDQLLRATIERLNDLHKQPGSSAGASGQKS